jgi:hypothetical protein
MKLSKLILGLAIASVFTLNVNKATAGDGGGIHVGLQTTIGLTGIINPPSTNNITNTQGKVDNPFTKFNSKIGTQFGIVGGFDFNNYIGFQAELDYSLVGNSANGRDGIQATQRELDLNYLHIPIMLKVTSGGDGSKFYSLLGAQLGFLQSAKYTYSTGDLYNSIRASRYSTGQTIDAQNNFSSSDYSIIFGMGADIKITDHIYASAGIKVTYSFNDLNQANFRLNSILNNYSASNNAFGGLNIGVHYKL